MKQLITFLLNVNYGYQLWSDLRHYCQCSFDLPILNPQSAACGFFEFDPDLVILLY